MTGTQSMADILRQVAEAIREETDNPGMEISPETVAEDIPGWDSVAHARIMLNVERRLGIEIDMGTTFEAENVGELVQLLSRAAL